MTFDINSLPNARAKLRGHRYFGRASVSFSLLLGSMKLLKYKNLSLGYFATNP